MMTPLAGLLGPGCEHHGDLVFQGRVCVRGHLVGSITTDDLVEVAEGARVEGRVEAAQVLVAGHIHGDVVAHERATLQPTAVVRGTVRTPWLDVRLGASLSARVETSGER